MLEETSVEEPWIADFPTKKEAQSARFDQSILGFKIAPRLFMPFLSCRSSQGNPNHSLRSELEKSEIFPSLVNTVGFDEDHILFLTGLVVSTQVVTASTAEAVEAKTIC